MRQLTGSLLLLCACLPLAAGEADQKKRVKQEAQAMANAFLKGDYETFADYMHPATVREVGGRAKLLDGVKAFAAKMKARGMKVQSYKVGDCTDLVGKEKEWFAVVPYTQVMTAPGVRYTTKGYLVGASANGGKTWNFTDISKKNLRRVREIVPNFPEDLKLPDLPDPVIEKTK
jgi:hypothetical protein